VALNDRQAFPEQLNLKAEGPDSQNAEFMGMQMQSGTWETESQNANDIAVNDSRGSLARHEGARASDSLFRTFYKDYRRYRSAGARGAFAVIGLTQGFWASTVFRLSHWAFDHCRLPGLRTVVNTGCILFQKFIEVVTGICIPARCNIGCGLYIGHFGGIFIDSEARLGDNCNLAQGVTIGKGGRGEFHGVPVLGDRVHVGANAIILGKITIGNDAVIGPGAVVMNSVPPCGVAIGNPARVVGLSGSFDFVHYDGMENDPQRKSAWQSVAAQPALPQARNPKQIPPQSPGYPGIEASDVYNPERVAPDRSPTVHGETR